MLDTGDDMFNLKRFINGVVLLIFTLVISLLITVYRFDKNPYYFAQLLPLFMAIYSLLAWFVYLRQDKPTSRHKDRPQIEMLGHHEARLAKDPHNEPISIEASLDSNTLNMQASSADTEGKDPFWEDSLYTLVWSACLLALLATILYWYFQIGSRFLPL